MKKICCLLLLLILSFPVNGRGISFFSTQFENCVREYLGLSMEDDLLKEQLDTIAKMDLSYQGLSDIRDIVYLPSLTDLNLCGNQIEDISPLLSLNKLNKLNLSHNNLTDIDILTFSCSDSIRVDVEFNNIRDFSLFYTPSAGHIEVFGMAMQNIDDGTSVVLDFFSGIEKGTPVLFYKVYNNTGVHYQITVNQEKKTIIEDGALNKIDFGDIAIPTQVQISDEQMFRETYVIPATTISLAVGQDLVYDTGLPDSYTIGYISAHNGIASADNQSIYYKSSSIILTDTIVYSFYSDGELKGTSEFYINGNTSDLKDVVSDSGIKTSWLFPDRIHLYVPDDLLDDDAIVILYDLQGKVIKEFSFASPNGIDEDIYVGQSENILVFKIVSKTRTYSVFAIPEWH